MTVLEALRHAQATRDEVVKAEHSLAMAAEFARYASTSDQPPRSALT